MNNMKFKVDSPEQSEALQKVLFSMGCDWAGFVETKSIRYSDKPYIFLTHNRITFASKDSEAYFYWHSNNLVDTNNFIKQHTKEAPVSKENNTPHVHADLIKQWADGDTIQVLTQSGWINCVPPCWLATEKYRVKPAPSIPTTTLQREQLNSIYVAASTTLSALEEVADAAIEEFITSGAMDDYINSREALQ